MGAAAVAGSVSGRQRLPEAQRREQILRAALEIAREGGLGAVTAQRVGAAAGLSSGLVFFHFETVERLRGALVDWVLDGLLAVVEPPASQRGLPPRERLAGFLGERLGGLGEDGTRRSVALLLEVWVASLRRPGLQEEARAAVARYRATFVPIAEAAIGAEPARFRGVGAEALAGVALSVVLGSALQAAVDPERFDEAAQIAALRALLLPVPPRETLGPRSSR
ncbi:TetR/AcrR family transcriptional regulator [Chondromyces apiculatus]|uniref:Transcriptional regulator, TetR family n=1 Tax=Chondromyces apiculatus DSM 436 TaxID=1192034 RepID=A0A017T797_9BACT|nr:TetR/AcrR family transcriptional regulator [Chondromyces apiculatus]EYF05084.1 Transcriptional regulator, TetR family [Chondromyces apiculatus DSM 436]